ncbi:MAG: glycoside hydrolase family 32 protein [Oscillochloridaceae bacterium umkhey_bin13]
MALQPDPGGPDADGCWSGCAVDDAGLPTLIYSGHRHGSLELPCRATSHDGLQTWHKDPANPLCDPPADLDLLAMRDHCVWPEAGGWSMLMGAGLHGRGGAALHFRSPDLQNWRYLGPLLVADELPQGLPWTGSVWECPDLFPLGTAYALTISVWEQDPNHSLIMLGDYQHGRFRPTQAQKLDYGDRYWYAPQSFRDQQERRLVFGWIAEGRNEAAHLAAGWAGVMSLPRQLACDAAGRLCIRPADEVTRLRQNHVKLEPVTLPADQLVPLDFAGDTLELALRLEPAVGSQVGLAPAP